MHKNVPVIDIEIDLEIGSITKINKIFDTRRLPVGTEMSDGKPNRRSLNDWWMGRTIPASRDGIREALRNMGVSSSEHLIEKCYGLSLSDQYWFSPKEEGLKWENINFFQNEFSKDVGEILFGREPDADVHINLMSPDNTSDGWLRKKWIIADGKRLLMKGSSRPYNQEPFNEVIASAVMRRLGIYHADYKLMYERERPYSLCENFVTPDTELVSARRVWETQKRSNNDSVLTHLLRCCESLEIPGAGEAINRMLTLDYIISNEDRHFNNFGFVRDVNTLEWKSFSPIFDSGTSLWYNERFVGRETECKPFKSKHEEQIKLVSDLSWYDYSSLDGIKTACMEILAKSNEPDEARNEKIAQAVAERCETIERMREHG
jgi:hypothetical protein